ncbi:MAG: hypothetical protein IIA45_05385 [Bacteroidetes bacterium]|nr:hypothetical protein [Bacteroidota bacterium]
MTVLEYIPTVITSIFLIIILSYYILIFIKQKKPKLVHKFSSITIIIPALIFSGCATWKEETGPSPDKLMRIMKQYNVLFETHSGAMGATFVEPKHLEKYHIQADEVRERVTFSDSVMLSIVFLKDGKPVKQTHMTPEKDSDYNEAEVTMRYKLVISPSNTVRTLITKQKWITSGTVWYLIPDLDPFLK